MRILFHIIFWFVYFPLMRLIVLFLFWNGKMEVRERFEKRNKFEGLAHSFKETFETADICFEFSSEGEYQQAAPLIDDALKAGKKVELVFFSPSVEKTILKLASQYPSQIRYLRYPLVRIFPFIERRCFTHWVTAKTLVLVRYDLFPEFLLWSMKKDHHLKMIWFTFKKDRMKGRKPSLWKKLFLKEADSVFYAGADDALQGKSLGVPGKAYDFRMEQIRRRVEKKNEKFQALFPLYPDFIAAIKASPKRVILGNAWPSDLKLVKALPHDVLLVIVPHELSNPILNAFHDELGKMGRNVFEINDLTKAMSPSSALVINKKGILCELYADFNFAYVGGGFEGSIHSVLEPLVAGSPKIACGPAHFRSTEYDAAKDLGRIAEINTPEQFSEWLNEELSADVHARMDEFKNAYQEMRELVISC